MTSNLTSPLIAHLQGGTANSASLESVLHASQSAVSRLLRELVGAGQILRIGRARAARYGYRRRIEPIGSQWPLRRVNEAGEIDELGILYSLAADEYFLYVYPGAEESGFAYGGLSHGLPYFLQDQRPSGFLGRAIPAQYPELNLPERVADWNDDQYLRYLTKHGSRGVGDLILGDSAFNEFLTPLLRGPSASPGERAVRYPELADIALRGALTGSSAHGEHPKFTVILKGDGTKQDKESVEVIVKFSPLTGGAVGRRWGDLLIAEHQAHRILNQAGVLACESEIIESAGRIFLEVRRFDRRGTAGRIGVSSFLAIDNGLIGGSQNWLEAALSLGASKRIDEATVETVRLVSIFGALIANTDRHLGNLACLDHYDGQFSLAPIYDMLPMLFVPSHDELVKRVYEPADPTSATMRAWGTARDLAEKFWQTLTLDERISAEFRDICAACLLTLQAMPRTGAYAYKA